MVLLIPLAAHEARKKKECVDKPDSGRKQQVQRK